MTSFGAEWCEKAFALLVLVACALATVAEQAAVGEVERALSVREQRLARLRDLRSTGPGNGSDPASLDGLFPGAALAWRVDHGVHCLQLRPAAERRP